MDPKYDDAAYDDVIKSLFANKITWTAGEAFDDSSHVLLFDHDAEVRLIGCVNNDGQIDMTLASIAEGRLDADLFYGTLHDWKIWFETTWANHERHGPSSP